MPLRRTHTHTEKMQNPKCEWHHSKNQMLAPVNKLQSFFVLLQQNEIERMMRKMKSKIRRKNPSGKFMVIWQKEQQIAVGKSETWDENVQNILFGFVGMYEFSRRTEIVMRMHDDAKSHWILLFYFIWSITIILISVRTKHWEFGNILLLLVACNRYTT